MCSNCRNVLFRAGIAVAALGLATLVPARVHASERVLRVAADPNNLPFSNDRLEGFENKIAALLADELKAKLEYMWWPQRRGFFRETIGSGRADVVIGVPAGFERADCTRPYYASTYVFVQKPDSDPVRSFDDPRLAKMRIGVQLAGDDGVNTPPAHALSRRGFIENLRGYSLFGDYRKDSPPAEIIHALSRGEIDLAVAWGPMASFFAAREETVLTVTPGPASDGPLLPMRYAIAVGVRRGAGSLRDEIDAILERRADAIAAILDEYRVPLLPIEKREPAPTR